jgi:ketosteroid isomerase-like protein
MAPHLENRAGSKMILCVCLALLVIASACSQPTAVDTRAADATKIRDLDAQWSKSAVAHDLDATVSYYADDASVLPPNAPIATGKAAIRAVWATMVVPDVSVSWQSGKVEVSLSGDLAYDMGTYQMTMKDPEGKSMTDHGKFVEVWKKQPDKTWKTVADIFNSDLPPPPPSPPEKKK